MTDGPSYPYRRSYLFACIGLSLLAAGIAYNSWRRGSVHATMLWAVNAVSCLAIGVTLRCLPMVRIDGQQLSWRQGFVRTRRIDLAQVSGVRLDGAHLILVQGQAQLALPTRDLDRSALEPLRAELAKRLGAPSALTSAR